MRRRHSRCSSLDQNVDLSSPLSSHVIRNFGSVRQQFRMPCYLLDSTCNKADHSCALGGMTLVRYSPKFRRVSGRPKLCGVALVLYSCRTKVRVRTILYLVPLDLAFLNADRFPERSGCDGRVFKRRSIVQRVDCRPGAEDDSIVPSYFSRSAASEGIMRSKTLPQ